MEMLQARREWQEIFQVMKTKGLQPRLLCPARLLIKMEGQISTFPDKKKSKRIHLHQTWSERDAKGNALRKGRKSEREEHKYKKMAIDKYLPIITININGLSAPIKRPKIAEWMKKHDPHISCLQETHLKTKDLHRLKVKVWKQFFQANREKKPG